MTVKLFTQANCAPCTKIKEYFKSKGIEYIELDRAEHSEEMLAVAGVISTPVVSTEKGVAIGLNWGKIFAITT